MANKKPFKGSRRIFFIGGMLTLCLLFSIPFLGRNNAADNNNEFIGKDKSFYAVEQDNWETGSKYSIIIPTLNRELRLKALLEHFDSSDCPSLAKIYVSWVNKSAPLPDFLTETDSYKYPIEVIDPLSMGLHHRFDVPPSLETNAVFSHDDDLRLPCDDLEDGFQTWLQFPKQIVGFVNRHHQVEGDKASWTYGFPGTGAKDQWYSMILTDASFLHRNWMENFFTDSPAGVLDFIENNRNCEDIAMNFLVAHKIKKPPIYMAGKVTHFSANKGGISNQPNHISIRSECLNRFAKYYGYMPLDFAKSYLKVSLDTREQMIFE